MRTDQLLLPLRSRYIYDQAATIYATIADGDDFPGDAIFDFFVGHEKFLLKPNKETILHEVMRELLGFYSDYWISKAPDSEFEFYKERLPALGIYPPKWFREGNWEGHEDDLRKLARKGRETVLPSVFYLLFSDRDFLTTFQLRVAQYVRTLRNWIIPISLHQTE